MPAVLLAFFPILLLFDTRAAFGALAVAIVLLVRKRVDAARPVRRRVEEDWSA